MREFGKIKSSLWGSQKFDTLLGNNEARLLYLYLHTSPHGNSIGCFRMKKGYVMEDLGWDQSTTDRSIKELCEAGLIGFDCVERVVRIVDFLEHTGITNAKHASGAVKLALSLPDCHQKTIIISELNADPHAQESTELKGYLDRSKKTNDRPIQRPIPTQTNTNTETKKKEKGEKEKSPPAEPDPVSEPVDEKPPPKTATTIATLQSEPVEIPEFLDQRAEYSQADPVKLAVEAWNAFAEKRDLTLVQKLTDARRVKLKARLKDCDGLNGWHVALEKLGASSFLMETKRTGKHANWRPTFDFLVTESKFTSLMEGGYDDRSSNQTNGSDGAADDRTRRRRDAILQAVDGLGSEEADTAAGHYAGDGGNGSANDQERP